MFGGGSKKEDPKLKAEIQAERSNLQRLQATEGLETKIKAWEAKIEAKNKEIAVIDGVSIHNRYKMYTIPYSTGLQVLY